MKKSDREIMEILEAFDATMNANSAAELAGSIRRRCAGMSRARARDAGRPVTGSSRRERITDPFVGKIEEWVDRARGKVRADVVHEQLVGLELTGTERSTRWVVAEAKRSWRAGSRRKYRLWIAEQFDWGQGRRPRPGQGGAGDVAVLRVAGVVAL